MKAPGKVQLTIYLLGFAGAALFTLLLVRQGIGAVGAAMAAAGWGILAVAAFHLIPLFMDAVAWWVLFPKTERPGLPGLFWMRWIGESTSSLVPSAAVGGDIVRVRLATFRQVPLSLAAATVIADLTLGVFTQAGFTILGLVLLVDVTGQTNFVGPTLVGILIGVIAIGCFFLVQRFGMFRLVGLIISRLTNSAEWRSLAENGETFDQSVRSLYARRRGVIACCAWTIVSLLASSGEVWIALYALGLPADPLYAVILQSMAMTIRSGAFLVPGALGVQEGGYLLVGQLLGIPGETALALSLITRCRDLAVGIPGLLTWQFIEGRRFLRARSGIAER